MKHPRLRHCFPQCPARPQLKHNFFSWKNCLLASIVLTTSHASPQCFPSQKIQTGSPFSLLYQCFSLFGRTPPMSPDASSTLCLQPVSKVVYQGLHIPLLPIFVGSHNSGPHLRYFVESGHHEPPKHVGFAHRQQRIVISAHALVKFLDLQVIGSFDDRKGHYFFYVCVHNKFALAILGFQSFPGYLLANFIRLQVCDLCSYLWIDHFQQIAEFLRYADRFVVDLCDKHLLESNPVAGRSFEQCYYQFGQYLLWFKGLLSLVPGVYASPVILHQFSAATYVARALPVANATQLNGAPLLAVVLVWLQIVFFPFPRLFPPVCCLRTSLAFLCPREMWNTWPSRPSFSAVTDRGDTH